MFGLGNAKRIEQLELELAQCRLELQQAQDELAKRIEFDDENQKIKSTANSLIEQNALVLHTATSGLTANSQIIELAIVDVQGNIVFDSLIKPKNKLSKDNKSISVHGITNELLANAPKWEDVFEQVANIVNNRSIFAYNSGFHSRMFVQTCEKIQLEVPKFDVYCGMALYAAWYGHLSQYRLYREHKLVDAMSFIYGDYWQQSHRALPDCLAVLDLLKFVATHNMRPRFF